jgi:hypothetical protein
VGPVYSKGVGVSMTLEALGRALCVWIGDSEAVYLGRGAVWSIPLVEPHQRDRRRNQMNQIPITSRGAKWFRAPLSFHSLRHFDSL